MNIVHTVLAVRELLEERRRAGLAIGFVPTMGALHEGHLSLVRAARAENDIVVVSVFVNPTQFGPGEDYTRYPRNEARDLALLEAEAVDIVFMPTVQEMYPALAQTSIDVGAIATRLEGARRPGHFDGVATVVTKLFAIIGPRRAYFGQKDAQQVATIRQIIRDLHLPVALRVMPVAREPNGLAMSSRNIYLSPEDRAAAGVLWRALRTGRARYRDGERSGKAIEEAMAAVLAAEPRVVIDYACLVDPQIFVSEEQAGPEALLVVAASAGQTRLIDAAPVADGAD